ESAHDVAEGGIAVALAECCLAGAIGAEVELGRDLWATITPGAPGRGPASPVAEQVAETLFGEASGGFIVSGEEAALSKLGERTRLLGIGTVGGERLVIRDVRADSGGGSDRPPLLDLELTELAEAHAALAE